MNIRQKIASTFAYKAEWLQQDMFSLYTEPAYFPDITGPENCLLIGGRGTGKTTVLKGLSYLGQEKLNQENVSDWSYLGLYYRVDSSRVSAFNGLNRTDEDWVKPFAHYISLIVASLVSDLLKWYCEKTSVKIQIDPIKWTKFRTHLGLEEITTVEDLQRALVYEISNFERYINNISRSQSYEFSILGAPIDSLFEAISSIAEFSDKRFFIILDEYENFSDYQQQVVNTLIKEAAGKSFCFKVGVRELGWRNRITLNNQELRSPRDYRKIDIKEELKGHFKTFAEQICNDRINSILAESGRLYNVNKILPGLTIEEEAKVLGVEKALKGVKLDQNFTSSLNDKSPLFIWFLFKWAKDHNQDTDTVLNDYLTEPHKWYERYENYKYASLFTINSGKGTGSFRKLYCGWKTYLLLSSYNIAFILQLVETALLEQLSNHNLNDILKPITPEVQTMAALKVARSNFDELEGIGVNGPQIMLLVQGFGRIFEIFGKSLLYAPEINSFWIADKSGVLTKEQSTANKLLSLSVSHLALQRSIANKLDTNDPRTYDYSLHPIYSPLFVFSHRKKRKTRLNSSDILSLISNQAATVNKITQPSIEKKRGPLSTQKQTRLPKSQNDDGNAGSISDQLSLF